MTGARIIAAPTFDPARRIDFEAPAGSTIADIVTLSIPGATPMLYEHVRVTVGERVVEREWWWIVRPPAGAVVIVRVLPGNSGALRTALSIAVSVAAIAAGQLWLGPLLASSSLGVSLGLTTASASAIASGVTLGVGQALLNAIVPLRSDQSKSSAADSPSYSVQGFRNVANLDGVLPCPLGTIRFAPPYAALPYTEIVNGESYVIAIFILGYGPLTVSDLRLGDTPIDKYKEVEVEIREGYADDEPITLYPKQVLQQQDFSVDLSKNYSDQFGAHTRFTAADVTESSIDLLFPGGMFWMRTDVSGSKSKTYAKPFSVEIRISERKDGVGDWTEVAVWSISEFKQNSFYASYKWTHGSRGRWEIKVERLTADLDDLNAYQQADQFSSVSIWTVLRSFRPEYPIATDVPLALVAMRVRGTKQLNGVIENFTCKVERVCLDWDAEGEEWVERETRNPASLYRYAMQGPLNLYPFSDEEIDLDWLQDEFHPFCEENGLTYDRVHDFEQTLFEAMSDICAAGRAFPRDDGEKWTGFIDKPQEIVFQHLTPRNAYEFGGEHPKSVFPDGFRVKFQDETNDYKNAERVIPWPGFVGTPENVESIDIPGVCSPDNVWLEARKKQYEAIYRPDTFTIMQDAEGMFAARGDLCELSYPTLSKTQQAAYVKAVNGNAIVLDDFVTMETGKTYAVRIRHLASDDSSPDQSVLRSVTTVAGEQDALILTGSGTIPSVGDLIIFGESTNVSLSVLVREVEATEDLGARLTFVPYAPEIFELLAEEEPPAWNGRAGSEIVVTHGAPAVPVVRSILSGLLAGDVPPISVLVLLSVGSGSGSVTSFEVDHRLKGAVSWTTVTTPVSPGSASFTGYAELDTIEIRARAVGPGGNSSYSTTTEHIVAYADTPPRLAFSNRRNSQYLMILG